MVVSSMFGKSFCIDTFVRQPPSTTALPYSTVCERPSIIIQCPSSSVCLDAQLKHVERGTDAGSQRTNLGSLVHARERWQRPEGRAGCGGLDRWRIPAGHGQRDGFTVVPWIFGG